MNPRLKDKLTRFEAEGNMRPMRIYYRNSVITPRMRDRWFEVHDGKSFKKLQVTTSMIGYKFGQFVPTRKFVKHSGSKVRSRVKVKRKNEVNQ